MAAANQDDFSFQSEIRYLQIKAGQTAVLVGEVLAVELSIAPAGVSGATIPQLTTPHAAISPVCGPIVVALEAGVAGQRIRVQWQGPCRAKMGGATVNPFCPLFIRSTDVANRRFLPTVGADLRNAIWGWTVGRLTSSDQLVEVMLAGANFIGFSAA